MCQVFHSITYFVLWVECPISLCGRHRSRNWLLPCFKRQELCPEKRMLFYPKLPKIIGSDYLEVRIRSIHGIQGSAYACHVFGHTHFCWDAVVDGIRYCLSPTFISTMSFAWSCIPDSCVFAWWNAGMCRHHWLTQGNGRDEWKGVKIGYHFASILMGNFLIHSLPVIGPTITLPTKEHLTTPNLLLGLPDSITKHNTLLIVYTPFVYLRNPKIFISLTSCICIFW